MKNFLLTKTSLAVCLAFGLQPAFAVETTNLDAVTVTAQALKINTDTEQTPQSVSVIDRQEIDNKILRKVDDALRYVPGFVNPYGADYDTNWMRMRGFQVTTLVDGQVQYQEGYFDTTVEPYGLESIEVLSGPASALYGDSQPGGVVNLVTKKPTKTPQHSVTLTGGTQSFVQAGLDISDNLTEDGSQRFRLVAMGNREDSFVNGVNGWRGYIAPSWTIDISKNTSLTLMASYLKEDRKPSAAFMPAWGTVVDRDGRKVPYGTNYGDPEHDTYDKDQLTFGWEFKHAFNDHLEYKQTFTAKHTDLYFRTTAAYGSLDGATAPSDGGLYRATLLNDGDATSFTLDNNLTGNWMWGDFDSLVQVGFDYQHHKNDWEGNGLGVAIDNADPFNPSHTGMPSDSELSVWDNSIKKEQLGVYGQLQTVYNETFLIKGGLRYDMVNIDATNDNPDSINSSDSLDEGELSWNAGLMYFGPMGLSPYVNYSEAFYTNASMVQLGGWTPGTYGYYIYEPINTKQLEVGVKFTPDWLDGFINVAWFNLKQENALAQSVIGGVLAQSQVSEKEAQGVEVQMRAALTENLIVNASYTYQDVTKPKYQDAFGDWHDEAELTPEHIGSVWVSYNFARFGLPGLTIGNGIRYLGSTRDTIFRHKVDSATLWDANVIYDFDKHWRFVGTATNITDHRYVAGCDWNTAYYGEGRVVRASLTYNW